MIYVIPVWRTMVLLCNSSSPPWDMEWCIRNPHSLLHHHHYHHHHHHHHLVVVHLVHPPWGQGLVGVEVGSSDLFHRKRTSPLTPCCCLAVAPLLDQGLVEVAVVVVAWSVGVSQAACWHSRNGGWCLLYFVAFLSFLLLSPCCGWCWWPSRHWAWIRLK